MRFIPPADDIGTVTFEFAKTMRRSAMRTRHGCAWCGVGERSGEAGAGGDEGRYGGGGDEPGGYSSLSGSSSWRMDGLRERHGVPAREDWREWARDGPAEVHGDWSQGLGEVGAGESGRLTARLRGEPLSLNLVKAGDGSPEPGEPEEACSAVSSKLGRSL